MNREQRRQVGVGPLRPTDDLMMTAMPPFVLVGFYRSGYIRLSAAHAEQLAGALLRLAGEARAGQS